MLRISILLKLKIICSQNTAKKLSQFTNFPANMFPFGVRKNICTAPFPDAQELLSWSTLKANHCIFLYAPPQKLKNSCLGKGLFVWGISLFWLHALLSMSFCCFLRLLPPPSQVTCLQNGPCKDIYIAMGGIPSDYIMRKRSKIWKSII